MNAKTIFLEQVVNRDLAFVLFVGGAAADRGLIQRHRDEAIAGALVGSAHDDPLSRRSATERA